MKASRLAKTIVYGIAIWPTPFPIRFMTLPHAHKTGSQLVDNIFTENMLLTDRRRSRTPDRVRTSCTFFSLASCRAIAGRLDLFESSGDGLTLYHLTLHCPFLASISFFFSSTLFLGPLIFFRPPLPVQPHRPVFQPTSPICQWLPAISVYLAS